MVAIKSLANKPGNILDLINLREIREEVMCLRLPKKQEQEYKAVIAIHPVNFSLMSEGEQEAILEGFRVLLQRLQTGDPISIHVRVRPYDLQPYLTKLQEAKQRPAPIIQEMAVDHEQFVLALASQHAILQREFYIRVGIHPDKLKTNKKLTTEERFEQARSQLDLRCSDLLEDIQRCSLAGHRLEDNELAQYYLSCIHSHYAEKYPLATINLQAVDSPVRVITFQELDTPPTAVLAPVTPPIMADVSSQETVLLTPVRPEPLQVVEALLKRKAKKKQEPVQRLTDYTTLVELLQPALIKQHEHFLEIHREQTEYFRGRAVCGYPAYVIAGWLDRLIQIDEPYVDILLYVETLEPTAYTGRLSRKITGFRATQTVDARAGRTENPYIKAALEEVETLRDKIVQQVERVHGVSLYICARAASLPELKQRDERIASLLRSLDLEAVELSLEHLQAWLCCLPDSRDVLLRRKILETSSVVTAFPFASSSLSTEPGMLVGVMPNGALVIINPVSDQLENGHEVKFARSGAGKSYDEKVRLARALLMGLEAIVIDPEDEYVALCQKFGGANIRLSSGALQLNPFDLALTSNRERNLLEEKFQSLLVLFDLLLAEKDPGILSQREKSYLNKCLARCYADRGITSDPATHGLQPPSMHDFYTIITSGVCGPDGFDLGDRLARHLAAFPRATAVSLDNPLVVFNIRDLADELKPAGLFLITEFVDRKS